MKKIKSVIILTLSVILCIGLCACGADADAKESKAAFDELKAEIQGVDATSDTGVAAEELTSEADAPADEPASKFEAAKLQYITNADDDIYFVPASDDYMYWIRDDEELKEEYVSEITMTSFDKSGQIIQVMHRTEHPYRIENRADYDAMPDIRISSDGYVQYQDMYMGNEESYNKTEGTVCVNKKLQTIYNRLKSLRTTDEYELVLSKELTPADTRYENDMDHPALEQLISFADEFGSDYCIKINRTKEEHEASLHYGVIYDQGVIAEPFALYRGDIYFFDEKGDVNKYFEVMVFDSADQIEEYKKHMDVDHNEDWSEITVDAETWERVGVQQMNLQAKDNIFYADFHDRKLGIELDGSNHKWQHMLDWGTNSITLYYLSKPELSEQQIQRFLEYYHY